MDLHPGGKSMAEAMVVDLRLLDTWPMECARQQKALADPEENKRAATEQKERHNALLKKLGIFGKKPRKRDKQRYCSVSQSVSRKLKGHTD
ncbi:hypothetical protein TYRP_020407 [Tyrophagus putrescentiae]|nr:hypothetical protein TYRP_020407 [Tyrophagus putrescentiae]